MERDTAIKVAQEAIKAQNNRLITQVLKLQATRPHDPDGATSIDRLPQIAVTCATGWECYAIVAELIKTRRFRVRALYRTPGTPAAARLETLRQTTEQSHPGLLTLRPHTDLFSNEILTEAFADCAGVVIYVTANVSKNGASTSSNPRKDEQAGCSERSSPGTFFQKLACPGRKLPSVRRVTVQEG